MGSNAPLLALSNLEDLSSWGVGQCGNRVAVIRKAWQHIRTRVCPLLSRFFFQTLVSPWSTQRVLASADEHTLCHLVINSDVPPKVSISETFVSPDRVRSSRGGRRKPTSTLDRCRSGNEKWKRGSVPLRVYVHTFFRVGCRCFRTMPRFVTGRAGYASVSLPPFSGSLRRALSLATERQTFMPHVFDRLAGTLQMR